MQSQRRVGMTSGDVHMCTGGANAITPHQPLRDFWRSRLLHLIGFSDPWLVSECFSQHMHVNITAFFERVAQDAEGRCLLLAKSAPFASTAFPAILCWLEW